MAHGPDATTCAMFLLAAFSLAGTCQAFWLGSAWSRNFDIPLDGGRTWRGRRIFGDNKTFRGLVVMVPATALSFAVLAATWPGGSAQHLWTLSVAEYAVLGGAAGLGFMAGELPNSFVKRRLDVPPGSAARGRWLGAVLAVVDRCDSVVGAMTVMAIVLPVPLQTWALVALVGPALHGTFSVAVFHLGGKARLG